MFALSQWSGTKSARSPRSAYILFMVAKYQTIISYFGVKPFPTTTLLQGGIQVPPPPPPCTGGLSLGPQILPLLPSAGGGGGGAAVRTRLGSKLVLRVRLVNSQTMHRVSHPGDEPRHCLSREEKNSATPQTPPRRSGSHEGPGLECGCELVSGIWSHVPRPLGVQNGEVSQRGRTGSNVREAGGP